MSDEEEAERPISPSRRQFLKYTATAAIAAAVAGSIGFYAGSYVFPAKTSSAVTPVKLGGTLPLTGAAAADGQAFYRGYQLAISKINQSGGLLGRPVQLIIYDYALDPTQTTTLYNKLVSQDNVDILLGPYGGGVSVPAAGVAAQNDKLMICGFTSVQSLHQQYGGSSFFAIDSNVLGAGGDENNVIDFLNHSSQWNTKNAPLKKLSILDLNTAFGQDAWTAMQPIYSQNGYDVVYHDFVDTSTSDYTPIVENALAAGPDVLLATLYEYMDEGVIAALIQQKPSNLQFVYGFEVNDHLAFSDLGGAVNNITYLDVFPSTYHGGDADYLRQQWQSLYGFAPRYEEPSAYAAPELIANVVNSVGSLDKSKIISALTSQSFDTCYTKVQFDSKGHNLQFLPSVGQWQNSQYQVIWPGSSAESSTASPIYPYVPGSSSTSTSSAST